MRRVSGYWMRGSVGDGICVRIMAGLMIAVSAKCFYCKL